jgi:hypothetical protein
MDTVQVFGWSLDVNAFDPGALAAYQQPFEEGAAKNPVTAARRRAN